MKYISKVPFAKLLRLGQTDSEQKIWCFLRSRRFQNVKFRRQHPLGPYVVDFCSKKMLLVIELDGGQHSLNRSADAERTVFIEKQGYKVLRFWDNDVLLNLEAVLEKIRQQIEQTPSPYPLPNGEGDNLNREKNDL